MTNLERAFVIQLYSEYAADLFAYAYQLVRNKSYADDLIQTAFLEACKKVEKQEPVVKWKAWLYGVVRNTYRNDCKTRKREVPIDDLEFLLLPYEMDEPLVFPRDLPEEYREILQMRAVERLGYDRIGERLKISEAVARQRFSRAAKEYRQKMRDKI